MPRKEKRPPARQDMELSVAAALSSMTEWQMAAAKRTHRTAEATPIVIAAVRRAEMDVQDGYLDELMN
jgi:hypothetical protein